MIKELNIELDDKATKTDKGRIESNCGQLIRQYQLSFPIILNGLVIGQMEGPKILKEEEKKDRLVTIQQKDFDGQEYELDSNPHRHYDNEESILVGYFNKSNEKSTLATQSFDSLIIHYFARREIMEKRKKNQNLVQRTMQWFTATDEYEYVSVEKEVTESFYTLASALTDGCEYLYLGDRLCFSGQPHLEKIIKTSISIITS